MIDMPVTITNPRCALYGSGSHEFKPLFIFRNGISKKRHTSVVSDSNGTRSLQLAFECFPHLIWAAIRQLLRSHPTTARAGRAQGPPSTADLYLRIRAAA